MKKEKKFNTSTINQKKEVKSNKEKKSKNVVKIKQKKNTKARKSKALQSKGKSISASQVKGSLKVRFLGGVGEIGKNMTALEFGKDIIIIDAGVSFPTGNMPGVDLVIQDTTFLQENKSRIKGIIITHGHEDHIGSLPYILKELNVPVYGTKLTLTLIENKLKEHKLNDAILNGIKPGATIKLGCFSIEFINVNHSIAGAVALSITTPIGVVFHSGDFKIDYTPVAGETMDLARISEIGKKGVLLLMAESTNIEIEGTTMSESVVKETLDHVFADNLKRRIIIATFASNVHRLQQILDLAKKYKRKVAFSGRSMMNIAESASKIGELSIPSNLIIDIEQIKNFKSEQVVIISTGTQGEPMSALTRMASGEFNKVTIGENDTVVMSSSVIPGNERMIYSVINNLYKLGAEVIYESLEPIHVSGHALRGELRTLHSLVKPKFFIPVHGEYRHLKKHARLAMDMGLKESCIQIAEIGDTIELTAKTIKKGERFVAGSRFVDGLGIDGLDSFVIRDRIHLSEDGVIVVATCLNEKTVKLESLEIVAKGMMISSQMLLDLKEHTTNMINKVDISAFYDQEEFSNFIRRGVKNYIFKNLKQNPLILPIIMVV